MTRVLVTGMSGTGKSTVLAELGRRGHRVVDTDYGGWSIEVAVREGGIEQLWREDRMSRLLAENFAASLFVAGTVSNQGMFYDRFDAVILLSAPLEVLMKRLEKRSTNPFGKSAADRERIAADFCTVQPLLQRTSSVEIDATRPVAEVVDAVATAAARLPRP